MEDWIIIVSTPVITGLIGWLTNRVAIRMLFRPRRAVGVWVLKWQGLVPRRHLDIADKAGQIVQSELLSRHVMQEEIRRINLRPYVDEYATRLVWDRIGPRLRAIPLFGNFVKDTLLYQLTRIAMEEMNKELEPMLGKFAAEAERHIDVRRIVRERVEGFDLDQLEGLIYRLAGKEFRGIEIAGGVLGFVVGLGQLALLMALGFSA